MSEASLSTTTRRRRRWLIFAGLAAVAASTAAFFLWPDRCVRLERLKNVAIAQLESAAMGEKKPYKLPEADAAFIELCQELPDDPLAPRNLTIARIMALERKGITPEETQTAIGSAYAALRRLLTVDGASAAGHVLAARLAMRIGDEAQAEAEWKRATELAPDDPSVWYEFYDLSDSSHDAAIVRQGKEALAQAFRVGPTNLFVMGKLVFEQARDQDPRIKETIRALSETLRTMPGLRNNISKSSNGSIPDVPAFLDEMLEAALQGDWAEAVSHAFSLRNLLLPDAWARSDMRRIERNVLDFVLYEFSTVCRPDGHDVPDAWRHAVTFKEFAPQLPALRNVVDLELADFDLDGSLDVVVLLENAVEVYVRSNDKAAWRRLLSATVPPGYDHLLVADLDQDNPYEQGTQAAKDREAAEAVRSGRVHSGEDRAPPEAAPADVGNDGTPAEQNPFLDELKLHAVDVDLAIYGPAGVLFLRNDLDRMTNIRSLTEVPQDSPIAQLHDVSTVVAADIYHDGDLDLIASTPDGVSIWSNRGDMTFDEISGRSQLPPPPLRAAAIVPDDWDRDVDIDLLIAGSAGVPAGYLENLRHGQFRWRAFDQGFEALQSTHALVLFDVDGNGAWDLASTGTKGTAVIQTTINRAGLVDERASETVSTSPREGLATWDYDNDGHTDLLAWGRDGVDVFRGKSKGRFAPVTGLLKIDSTSVRTCRIGDLDGDGDEDLAIVDADHVLLFANEGGNANHWLNFDPRADTRDAQNVEGRTNHYALGSVIEIRTGTTIQRQVVAKQRMHFGLGDRQAPDYARIIWTTGVPQPIVNPKPDQVIAELQILVGSCPYLYTWNGERFEFYTDCLWGAPLGLQLADGVVAPSRSWEYLRIDGDKLRERNGAYCLQITEELWEAAYFDQVQLIAVDHPADVEVYSNEKVGPAEIAQFKVHMVDRRRPPLAALDQRGRDVLGVVRLRDGNYLKGFDRKFAPGWTEDHFLELDLGPWEESQSPVLFLTGWIYPTGTSVNVRISQLPGAKAPNPPALWVPDAAGVWHEVRPSVGFPGGKTKTIAIDLANAFLCDDHRVRIATNMEIYWDEAFFTLDEPSATVRLRPLPLASAEVHYRGFSRRTEDTRFGPEHYDYDDVDRGPKWPPMEGKFTRYGPVDEILAQADDMLVVMGAGDELTLEFTAPSEPLPAGWRRDFLLYNVGWDKDADLNTVYGQTVEPLPFGAMSGYPYAGDETFPDTPRHREYLRTYQTREQDPLSFWRQVIDGEKMMTGQFLPAGKVVGTRRARRVP
jgi:hypothetical protein